MYKKIEKYYNKKLKKFGATPQGVDWNAKDSQLLRFEQILKVIDKKKFSISDIGCGYGALVHHLNKNFNNYAYRGYDISSQMIDEANNIYSNDKNVKFKKIVSVKNIKRSDYIVASGIFNVKLKQSDKKWLKYILNTLHKIDSRCKTGFAFNILTKYSDKEFMHERLYYADPLFLFDYCKEHFSKNVALYHDYNLYEFTIIVRKED